MSQFVYVVAGLVGTLLAYKSVESIERIEEEVRIDLLLERRIPILSLCCPHTLKLHGFSYREHNIDQYHNAANSSLHKHRRDEIP